MSCAPMIPYGMERAIRKIHPSWRIKWNAKVDRWEIWGRTPYGKEYIVMIVQNNDGSYRNLDARTVLSLKRAMWLQYDPRKWKDFLMDEWNADEYARLRKDAAEEDAHLQIAKEAYRPFQMMARDMGFDSGKVKIPTIQGADIS
jgi:hypothetical protein